MLRAQPLCIYCGSRATTTDHCPPRNFFRNRHWPVGYEFPACGPCNASARFDEQALGFLVRIRVSGSRAHYDDPEMQDLLVGVINNQPDLIAEWNGISRDRTVDGLRKAFGSQGYLRFGMGWGALNLGKLSHAIVGRFMVKLAKALYYKHNGEILDGVVYARQIDRLNPANGPEHFEEILRLAPELSSTHRSGKSLIDQFAYRFNYAPPYGVLYAVVQFSEQFIFQLFVMRKDAERRMAAIEGVERLSGNGRSECYLLALPAPAVDLKGI